MKSSFSIKHSPHKLWELYKTDPPANYRRNILMSQFLHSFNSITRIPFVKNIVEFEHVLHLTCESRDYTKMVDGAEALFKKLSSSKIAALISPTKRAISLCYDYFEDFKKIENKFHHVPSAVKPKNLSIKQHGKALDLLFIGNKFWGKGGNIAIQVTKALNQNGVEAKLKMICNDIPINYPISDFVEVIRTTKLTDSDKARLYESADLFLFPVLHDSFGVHLECLEYSMPMITTDIYDKAEIIQSGVSGYLTKPPFELYGSGFATEWHNWDSFCAHIREGEHNGVFNKMVDDMAGNITAFYDDKNKLDQFRQSMLINTLRHFSLERRNACIKNVYESVCL